MNNVAPSPHFSYNEGILIYRIDVLPAPGFPNRRGAALLKDIADRTFPASKPLG